MMATAFKFGIPQVELASLSGISLDPSAFVGHDLIVLFCPTDPDAAAQELDAYRRRCGEFTAQDAWLVAVTDGSLEIPQKGRGRILALPDPRRHAWAAFRDLTECPETVDRESGATFLFNRGGNLHRYWHGAGHADDVVAELNAPAAERHQLS